MKLYKHFLIGRKGTPPRLYALAAAFGLDRIGDDVLRLEAQAGETAKMWKIGVLTFLCKGFGLTRTPQGSPGTYGLELVRNYEESDFLVSELLLLGGQPKYQMSYERDENGGLLLDRKFTRELRFGSAWNFTVVSNEIRHLLESAGLIGLQFREAVEKTGAGEPGCFWELQSSIVLPKMANTNRLLYVGLRGEIPQPFTGDYSRMVFLHDPPYRSGEIHYRRGDLASLRQFDIARTFELYRHPNPELIISQRCYRMLRQHGIKPKVEPVIVDAQ